MYSVEEPSDLMKKLLECLEEQKCKVAIHKTNFEVRTVVRSGR
jgi:hypothetical protein